MCWACEHHTSVGVNSRWGDACVCVRARACERASGDVVLVRVQGLVFSGSGPLPWENPPFSEPRPGGTGEAGEKAERSSLPAGRQVK